MLHRDLGAALGGERFLTEIRTTARLQHTHVLPLLDSGDADGLLYYVMPLVTGETLRARLERERQSAYIAAALGDKARAVSLLDFRTFNDISAHYDLIGEWLRDYPPFQEFITPRG